VTLQDREVGKTRLAIEVAHRMAGVFAHDICFLNCGVAEKGPWTTRCSGVAFVAQYGRSSTGAILDYLRDKTMLLC